MYRGGSSAAGAVCEGVVGEDGRMFHPERRDHQPSAPDHHSAETSSNCKFCNNGPLVLYG